MPADIDKRQQFVDFVKPLLERCHFLLIDEFAGRIKANHMVALLKSDSGEDFVRVGEELESAVAFSIVFLVAFEDAQ